MRGCSLKIEYVGGLLSVKTDSGTYFPQYDDNGNIVSYTDENDNVVAEYVYSPFGQIVSQSGSMADEFDFRFSTRQFDTETGLIYYGYRYYSPDLGRWMSRDPLEEAGSLNLYGFCNNNSVNGFDILGLKSWWWEDIGTALSNLGDVGHAALEGLTTGNKALGNAIIDTVVSTATVGAYDNLEMISVSDEERDSYGSSYAAHRIGTETLAAAGTAGLSRIKNAGNLVRYTRNTLMVLDFAQSTNMMQKGVRGASDGCVTLQDAVNILSGVVGVSPAASKILGKGDDIANKTGKAIWTKGEFKGTRVYQRDDLINPNLTDKLGRSNLERMQEGLAPIGPDGKSLNLHHTIQTVDSPIAEVTQTFHQDNSSIIHINHNTIPSGIDRVAFDKWRSKYWMNRAKDFTGGK